MKKHHQSLFAVFLLLIPLVNSQGQIPRTLSYQGIISDSLGVPKPDGLYIFTFSLYDSPSETSALWSEEKSLVVNHGLFSTVLGDQIPFDSSIRFDKQYWLSIQIGEDPELLPRIPFTSVGYSFYSLRADTAQSVDYGAALHVQSITVADTIESRAGGFKFPDGSIQKTAIIHGPKGDKGDRGDKGRKGLNWTGNWDNETDYLVDDAVRYKGSSYLAIIVNTDKEPPDSTFWSIMTEKGETGPEGEKGAKGDKGTKGLNWTGNWNPDTTYAVDDAVRLTGSTYLAILANTNEEPPDSTFWAVLTEKGEKGSQGAKGDQGGKGDTGSQGAQGGKGDTGSQGAPGSQGEKGDKGDKGDKGNKGLNWTGNWNPDTTYAIDDAVKLQGSSYLAILVNTNQEPPNEIYWDVLASKGGNSGSSRRWKENIAAIEDALVKIQQLRGVTFDWKSNGVHDIGLIAEEVGVVIPEIVDYEENGVDAISVNYARLVALLIEGMKEQQKQIDELQEALESQTNNPVQEP